MQEMTEFEQNVFQLFFLYSLPSFYLSLIMFLIMSADIHRPETDMRKPWEQHHSQPLTLPSVPHPEQD